MAGDFGLSEVRMGVLAHYIDMPGPHGEIPNLTSLQDIGVDLLFKTPDLDLFRWIGSPRPNLGGTLNLSGNESMVHLGLTWHADLFDGPVFVEGTFGGALQNGSLDWNAQGEHGTGCPALFYESVGLGTRFNDTVSMVFTVEHASNAGLCFANAGITSAGLKLGFKFD